VSETVVIITERKKDIQTFLYRILYIQTFLYRMLIDAKNINCQLVLKNKRKLSISSKTLDFRLKNVIEPVRMQKWNWWFFWISYSEI